MTRTVRTRRPALLVAGLAAAALTMLAPAAASAQVPAPPQTHVEAQGQGDDPLGQVLDPDQAQGVGQVVLDRGHVDFGPTLNTGEWAIQAHDATSSPFFWRHLRDVVLKVNDAAILPVPESEAYAFLGQQPGTEVWVVPQTQQTDVVWLGWNTQEPTVLNSLNLGTTLSVLNVEGPGEVVAYLQSGNFGDPQPLWSTLEPFPQQSWIEVNTHTHANWVFTEPGIYLVEIQFDADLVTGETVSARDVLRFAVGDATDPQPAFAMSLAETPPAAGEVGAADDGGSDEAVDDAPAESTDGGLGMIVWIVVGVIAAALLVALVIAVVASRRAKARAIAARSAERESA